MPVSTLDVMGAAVPVLAGNALRQLPQPVVQRAVDAWFAETNEPLVTYFHTWEMDPDQPQIMGGSRLTQMRHYRNLDQIRGRVEETLLGLECVSIAGHLGIEPAASELVARPKVDVIELDHAGSERPAISVVIPCYNEEEALPYLERTLAGLRAALEPHYDAHFLFVDDGSKDDTVRLLKEAFAALPNSRVVEHGQNQGVAAAILTGIAAAETEIVCSMDCDCSYDPLELLKMIPKLGPDTALVTASPYHALGGVKHVPGWRLLLSRGASGLYRHILQSDLRTYTSCFRVYRRSRVTDIDVSEPGFLGVAELLGRLLLSGEIVVEHPCILESRLFGLSKMKTLATIGGHLRLLRQLGAERARQSRA